MAKSEHAAVESFVKRKRHSLSEIAAKLQHADEMAADGMLQNDIARNLGISVMTYHRWRAKRPALERAPPLAPTLERSPPTELREARGAILHDERDRTAELDRLRVENLRLRRLLTDLLLEKAKLEETLHGAVAAG
jgi:putative transposase